MTQVISVSITDIDLKYIKKYKLSATNLLRKAIALHRLTHTKQPRNEKLLELLYNRYKQYRRNPNGKPITDEEAIQNWLEGWRQDIEAIPMTIEEFRLYCDQRLVVDPTSRDDELKWATEQIEIELRRMKKRLEKERKMMDEYK